MYNNVGTDLEYLEEYTPHEEKLNIILNGMGDVSCSDEDEQNQGSSQVDYKNIKAMLSKINPMVLLKSDLKAKLTT